MRTKALFPCGEGSNLILQTGTENQIFILRTPATIKFFHQILKNCHFGVKKNHYQPRWICITHMWNFHIWKNIVDLMKYLKYEHQSIFSLVGEGQT